MGYLGKNTDLKIKNVIPCCNIEEGPKWLFWLPFAQINPKPNSIDLNIFVQENFCIIKFSHEIPLGYFGSLSRVPLMECFQNSMGLVL